MQNKDDLHRAVARGAMLVLRLRNALNGDLEHRALKDGLHRILTRLRHAERQMYGATSYTARYSVKQAQREMREFIEKDFGDDERGTECFWTLVEYLHWLGNNNPMDAR